MTSSGSSRANPSIIATACSVPDTIRSSSLSSSSSWVGNGTNWPSMPPDAHRGDRAEERHGRNQQGRGGAVHRQHVGVILPIARQHHALALDFVHVPIGKQRTDRAIDQPRGQRFLGAGTPFPLEKPAGKLARRRKPLAIIAHQRKEIDSRPRRPGGDGVEHDRPAILHDDCRRRLASQLARFHR